MGSGRMGKRASVVGLRRKRKKRMGAWAVVVVGLVVLELEPEPGLEAVKILEKRVGGGDGDDDDCRRKIWQRRSE